MSIQALPTLYDRIEPAESTGVIGVHYIALSALLAAPRNPKDHDLGLLHVSMNRWGYTQPMLIDERTGRLTAGHGRLETLQQKQALGESPPGRVIAKGGEWYVPVLRGIWFNSDSEAEAYLLADNKLVEVGGWHLPDLATVLADLVGQGDEALSGTGWTLEEVSDLLTLAAPPSSLDELADRYGEPDETAFWPVVRIRVPPETFELYESLLAQAPGDDEAARFLAVLRAVDASALVNLGD